MQTHKKLLSSLLTGSLSLLIGVSFLPLQAEAGFEWVPSDQVQATAPAQAAPQRTLTPSSSGAPSVSSASRTAPLADLPAPLVIQGTPSQAKTPLSAPLASEAAAPSQFLQAPAPALAPAPASALPEVPAPSVMLPSAEAEIAPATSPTVKSLGTLGGPADAAPASAPGLSGDKPLRGFADNVPLAVALRQILPSDYGFSIDKDVSSTLLVSWKGGSSWHATLDAMLQKENLSMEEKGAIIRIIRASSPAPVPVPVPEPALAPAPASAPAPAAAIPSSAEQKPLDLTTAPKTPKMATLPDASTGPFLTPPPSSVPVSSAHTIGVPLVTHDIGDGTPQSKMVDSWVADRGQTLRSVLEAWSKKANVEMSWLSEYDYPIQASLSFTGTYEDAIRGILSGLQDAKPQPVAVLHNNQASGQSILVVQSRGNNYND